MKYNGILSIFLFLATGLALSLEKPTIPTAVTLHAAVLNLDLEQVKLVLESETARIHQRDKQCNTAYHILKAQKALIPLLATTDDERKELESKITALDSLLLSAGSDPESYNSAGKITPLAWYSFLNQDIQRDSILAKYAPLPVYKDFLVFNGVPPKYIVENSTPDIDIDGSDHHSLIIKQVRGNHKIYLKLEKLNPQVSFSAQRTPVVLAPKTREKIANPIDILHNFSTIIDQYVHWGKKINTDNIKNNPWVHLVLSNLKFSVKENRTDDYAILLKAYYCATASTHTRTFQEISQTQGLHPAALIYLFFNDSNVCYHRCLHSALNKDKFEAGFAHLNHKLK